MATVTSRANDLFHVLKKKKKRIILVRWSATTESCPTTEITLQRVFKLNKNQANHSIAIYLIGCNLPLGTNVSSNSVRLCTNTTLAVGPLQAKAMRGMGKKKKTKIPFVKIRLHFRLRDCVPAHTTHAQKAYHSTD